MTTDVFLMSPPRPDWHIRGRANVFSRAEHRGRTAIAQGAALKEWLALADMMIDAGATIAVLAPTADAALTGMPYTAEAGHLGRDADGPLFVLPNVKPPHRRGEAPVVAELMKSWGIRTWTPPVLWEGQGDVLDAGHGRTICTSGDGPHARSSNDACDHIAPFLPGRSLHLRFHGDPWFHGNTFLGFFHGASTSRSSSAITALLCEEALLKGELERLRAFLPDVRIVPIRIDESLSYPTNALQVGDTVLAPRGASPHAMGVWRDLGLDVRHLDLPVLFGAGGGAAVCLTNRLPLPRAAIPPAALYEAMRDDLLHQANAR